MSPLHCSPSQGNSLSIVCTCCPQLLSSCTYPGKLVSLPCHRICPCQSQQCPLCCCIWWSTFISYLTNWQRLTQLSLLPFWNFTFDFQDTTPFLLSSWTFLLSLLWEFFLLRSLWNWSFPGLRPRSFLYSSHTLGDLMWYRGFTTINIILTISEFFYFIPHFRTLDLYPAYDSVSPPRWSRSEKPNSWSSFSSLFLLPICLLSGWHLYLSSLLWPKILKSS